MWRQGDAFFACLGGGDPMRVQGEVTSPVELPERIGDGITYLPLAPMMHAAAQWTSFMWFFCGGKVVLMEGSLDPARVWRTIADEGVNLLTVVGDAVAKPLLDAWDAMPEAERPDVSTLFSISNGGAPMSTGCKARILDRFPTLMVNDGFGSSEAGIQGSSRVTAADGTPSGAVRFSTSGAKPTLVLGDDDEPVEPGSGVVGRIVTGGRLPLGYFDDPEKTAATFLEHDGESLAHHRRPGDGGRGRHGGAARPRVHVDQHRRREGPPRGGGGRPPRPSRRWPTSSSSACPTTAGGARSPPSCSPPPGTSPAVDDLVAHCKQHLAGYKVPKHVVLVDAVVRSPAGKADYRWAVATAAEAVSGS